MTIIVSHLILAFILCWHISTWCICLFIYSVVCYI